MEEAITPPVKEGEEIEVKIESIGKADAGGDGIAKLESGYTVIVLKGKLHETYLVSIRTVRATFAIADIITGA